MNRQGPANLPGALLHADQSEMTGFSISRYLSVKTVPVISYDQLHTSGIEHEIDEYPLGLRVLHGVVHCFLSDAQKIVLHRLGQRPKSAIDFNLCLDSSVMGQSPGGLRQRRG